MDNLATIDRRVNPFVFSAEEEEQALGGVHAQAARVMATCAVSTLSEQAIQRTATFSPCRQYRYSLWRQWGEPSQGYAMFIGLNPSTADETIDDPTIRRCVTFAKDWGYGALCMTNLFAFRATDPAVMKAHPEPVGEANDGTLVKLASSTGVVVAAWGVDGKHLTRDKEVLTLLPGLQCLALTKEGMPRLPLYLRKELRPKPLFA